MSGSPWPRAAALSSWLRGGLGDVLPLKLVFLDMENQLQILDIGQAHHVGAIQALCKPLLQHACNLLRETYNAHYVRPTRGQGGGRPDELWQHTPHPGGNPSLPAGYNAVAEYEQANNTNVRLQPDWVAARDPLYHQSTAKKDARMAAVLNIWRAGGGTDGGVGAVWSDILHNRGYGLFIPSYKEWLKHT